SKTSLALDQEPITGEDNAPLTSLCTGLLRQKLTKECSSEGATEHRPRREPWVSGAPPHSPIPLSRKRERGGRRRGEGLLSQGLCPGLSISRPYRGWSRPMQGVMQLGRSCNNGN